MARAQRLRWLAAVVAALTVWTQAGLPCSAEGVALFRGRVLAADGATPRSGVTIALVDEDHRTVARSAPSDDHGAFRFDAARPGTYVIVAEGPEGEFVADGHLRLRAGENPAVALALRPALEEPQDPDPGSEPGSEPTEAGAEEPKTQGEAPPPPPPPKAKEGLSPVVKGVIAGAVGLLAVAVILDITSDEEAGSPF